MIRFVVLLFLLALVCLVVVAARRPNTFRVERSLRINAPPARIQSLLNDFSAAGWGRWSPWEGRDPHLQRRFSGAPTGVGAVYEWNGDKRVGQGRMEILRSEPGVLTEIQLDFLKPFEAHNKAEFTLRPEGEGTLVNWAMHGPNPFFARLMQVFFSMDRMVGGDFESGLLRLKAAAESADGEPPRLQA